MLVYLLLLLASTTMAAKDKDKDKYYELKEGYNKNFVPPHPIGKPLRMDGVMNLRNILQVDEEQQRITMEITLR